MSPTDLRRRRRILLVMLTALSWRYSPGAEPELINGLRRWLGGWPGIGRIVLGMIRQGYDLELTRYGEEDGGRRSIQRAGTLPDIVCRPGVGANALTCGAARGMETLVKAERAGLG